MASVAALVYCIAALLLSGFHLALTAGAPWGKFTMGGFHQGALPPRARVGSFAQAILVAVTAPIIAIEAGFVLPSWQAVSGIGIWFVVVLFFVSMILNTITPSIPERLLGIPTALIMFTCSLIVALAH